MYFMLEWISARSETLEPELLQIIKVIRLQILAPGLSALARPKAVPISTCVESKACLWLSGVQTIQLGQITFCYGAIDFGKVEIELNAIATVLPKYPKRLDCCMIFEKINALISPQVRWKSFNELGLIRYPYPKLHIGFVECLDSIILEFYSFHNAVRSW